MREIAEIVIIKFIFVLKRLINSNLVTLLHLMIKHVPLFLGKVDEHLNKGEKTKIIPCRLGNTYHHRKKTKPFEDKKEKQELITLRPFDWLIDE